MRSRFQLPPSTQREAVQSALQLQYDASSAEHYQRALEWTRIYYHLAGLRNLLLLRGGTTSIPEAHYLDSRGDRSVRLEMALLAYQTEIGRLLSLDIGPAVQRPPGVSLDVVRRTALSQAVFDVFWERFDRHRFQMALMSTLAAYGTAGIMAVEHPTPTEGVYGASLMVVPPWELRPLPAVVTTPDEVGGVCWSRWVPLDWLRKHYGGRDGILRVPDRSDPELQVIQIPAGQVVEPEDSPAALGLSGVHPLAGIGGTPSWQPQYTAAGTPTSVTTPDVGSKLVDMVEFRQFWLMGDDHSCLRWSVMLGRKLVLDVDFTSERDRRRIGLEGNELPVCPMHIARYVTVSGFWGRGLMDRLVHLNREYERLMADLIQNMREADRLRMLAIPQSAGINFRNFREYVRNRVLFYQPDYASPNLRPEILSPPTIGDAHQKTIAMLTSLLQQLAGHGPMFYGKVPGRLDTGRGVEAVAKTQEVPLVPIVNSIEGAMSGAWKAILGILRRRLSEEDRLTIHRLDESLIGVQFDRASGTIRFSPDALPEPQQLRITIRSSAPVDKEALKQWLLDERKMGHISKVQYRILMHKLALPGHELIPDTEYKHYVTAWLENITLFGDGERPNTTITNAEADNHPIHLAVHLQFMASNLFRLASAEVRQAFEEHKQYHLQHMGALPENLEALTVTGQPGPMNPAAGQILSQGAPPVPGQADIPSVLEPIAGG